MEKLTLLSLMHIPNGHGNAVNWEPGSVVEKHSPVSMVAKLDNGLKRKCHIDQVQLRKQVPEPVNRVTHCF